MFDGLRKLWKEIVMESKKQDHEGHQSSTKEGDETPGWARDPEPDSPASLTIIQSFNDDGFEPIREWLQADPRVTGETTENGRHYSVPDGDDLPEWYAIRISTTFQHRESLKDDLQKMIDRELSGKYSVKHF